MIYGWTRSECRCSEPNELGSRFLPETSFFVLSDDDEDLKDAFATL